MIILNYHKMLVKCKFMPALAGALQSVERPGAFVHGYPAVMKIPEPAAGSGISSPGFTRRAVDRAC
jgi:hypothetical protein